MKIPKLSKTYQTSENITVIKLEEQITSCFNAADPFTLWIPPLPFGSLCQVITAMNKWPIDVNLTAMNKCPLILIDRLFTLISPLKSFEFPDLPGRGMGGVV